jgi:hypothetical protein
MRWYTLLHWPCRRAQHKGNHTYKQWHATQPANSMNQVQLHIDQRETSVARWPGSNLVATSPQRHRKPRTKDRAREKRQEKRVQRSTHQACEKPQNQTASNSSSSCHRMQMALALRTSGYKPCMPGPAVQTLQSKFSDAQSKSKHRCWRSCLAQLDPLRLLGGNAVLVDDPQHIPAGV